MEAAHRGRPRGRLRDRERRHARPPIRSCSTGVIFGKLGAHPEPIAFYRELERDAGVPRAAALGAMLDAADFDALVPRPAVTRRACGSTSAASACAALIAAASGASAAPVGAICHGVLVAGARRRRRHRPLRPARPPHHLPAEVHGAQRVPAHVLEARPLLPHLPRVRRGRGRAPRSASRRDFERGPRTLTARGTRDDDRAAFVVEDGNYVSARWPGDAYLFARRFLDRLGGKA